MTNFGDLVSRQLSRKGLTQREVERRSTVTQAALSAIVLGRSLIPEPATVTELIRVLDLSRGEVRDALWWDVLRAYGLDGE